MPRQGLSTGRVVDEAALVADEVGLDRLTLSTVAKRLSVSLPGLYKHIDSLDGLHRDLAIKGVRELTGELAAATVGRAGRDALGALARAYRDYAVRRPALAAASVRAPDPLDSEHLEVGAVAVRTVADALSGYQLAGDDLVHAIRLLRVTLHGFVSLEAAGGFGLPQSVDETFRRTVDSLDRTFVEWSSS